jgi:hypothetical protein
LAGASPWAAPFAARLAALDPLPAADRLGTLDAWAREGGLVAESGRPIRFVAAGATPHGRHREDRHREDRHSGLEAAQRPAYEARIFETGEVATRTDGAGARHDLYNALAWLVYPRTKARLNALHAQAIALGDGAAARGPLRDAATLFDENAALWIGLDASLEAALRAFDWQALFVIGRTRVAAAVDVRVFGHALLEKLDAPFKGITAHAWPLRLDPAASGAEVDTALAATLLPERLSGRAFCPLPVLGLPGWCDANSDPAFYNDGAVFRPGRLRLSAGPPGRHDQD